MSADKQAEQARRSRANRTVALGCLAFFGAMLGAAYASVPLYEMFCRVTGYGGTTQRVTQYSDTVLDRTINVRFDANISGGLPWAFKPVQREVSLRIGETAQVSYEASNPFQTPTAGKATFNVTPELAGAYFNKIECFCFTDTTLQPGESMDMPVVFFVDPAIVDDPDLKNIRTITLSYTFFPLPENQPLAASSPVNAEESTTSKTFGG
ncbi:cytochrome c oxidase assembly protein [Tianweitania sediminis]|uniref:Cytochrome c oxidase assembly protein CtaG n=1 Tax=Tianweitania sediminis TaxID=1502156 RepID=A0A8J7UID5_9HYPH|nr:cytochrome c oxidase assembly protein [Tianweitania sediminis]MBP0438798.1 cytochrome c oxidase assembly protein [Tianweitania sediminis]